MICLKNGRKNYVSCVNRFFLSVDVAENRYMSIDLLEDSAMYRRFPTKNRLMGKIRL